jgi:hypothetical protein
VHASGILLFLYSVIRILYSVFCIPSNDPIGDEDISPTGFDTLLPQEREYYQLFILSS